jgi:hypothetical protein
MELQQVSELHLHPALFAVGYRITSHYPCQRHKDNIFRFPESPDIFQDAATQHTDNIPGSKGATDNLNYGLYNTLTGIRTGCWC